MAFDGGAARDDRMLAHLCAALAVAPVRRLSPAELCMAVTSLSRLHGGKVLVGRAGNDKEGEGEGEGQRHKEGEGERISRLRRFPVRTYGSGYDTTGLA
jgi:hypothetical protein